MNSLTIINEPSAPVILQNNLVTIYETKNTWVVVRTDGTQQQLNKRTSLVEFVRQITNEKS